MPSGTTVVLGFGTALTILSLLIVALSFATDHWIDYTVDRDAVEIDLREEFASDPSRVEEELSNPWFFSRDRGMFRTCYPVDEAKFLDDEETYNVVDGECIVEDGYQLTSDEDKADWGDDYDTRIHLMRSHFAFFVFAMLMLVAGSIAGAVGCWKLEPGIIRIAGVIVFIGAFLSAGGMAFFHGYEYLERDKIYVKAPEFPKYWDKGTETHLLILQDHSNMRYGYSYYFGWIGMAVATIAAILYLCAAFSLTPRRPRRRFYNDEPVNMSHRLKKDPYHAMNADYPSRTGYGPEVMAPGYATAPAYMSKKSLPAPAPAQPFGAYPTMPMGGAAPGYGYY